MSHPRTPDPLSLKVAQELRERAVAEIAEQGNLDTAEGIPTGALLKLLVSTILAPGRNAASSLKAMQTLLEMKGARHPSGGKDIEAEMGRILGSIQARP